MKKNIQMLSHGIMMRVRCYMKKIYQPIRLFMSVHSFLMSDLIIIFNVPLNGLITSSSRLVKKIWSRMMTSRKVKKLKCSVKIVTMICLSTLTCVKKNCHWVLIFDMIEHFDKKCRQTGSYFRILESES